MCKNIILTGATGFLGSHILKDLLEKTNFNIIVLKRSFSDTIRIKKFINNKKIQFFDIDNTSLDALPFKNCKAIQSEAVQNSFYHSSLEC